MRDDLRSCGHSESNTVLSGEFWRNIENFSFFSNFLKKVKQNGGDGALSSRSGVRKQNTEYRIQDSRLLGNSMERLAFRTGFRFK